MPLSLVGSILWDERASLKSGVVCNDPEYEWTWSRLTQSSTISKTWTWPAVFADSVHGLSPTSYKSPFAFKWSSRSAFALTQLPWSPWLVSGRQTRHSAITWDLKRDRAPTCQFSAEFWENKQAGGWLKCDLKAALVTEIWLKANSRRGQD